MCSVQSVKGFIYLYLTCLCVFRPGRHCSVGCVCSWFGETLSSLYPVSTPSARDAGSSIALYLSKMVWEQVSIHEHTHIEYSIGYILLIRAIWLSDLLYGLCSSIEISCMAQECSLRMPEDFVLPLLPSEELKDKYRRYLFRDYVEVCQFRDALNVSVPCLLSANFRDYSNI